MTHHIPVANASEIKLFDKWSFEGIKVVDRGLQDYVSLHPVIFPKSGGRHAKQQFYKSKVNIVERLLNKMFVPGHRGKKHKISSKNCTGKTETNVRLLLEAFTIIEKKTGQNPIEVLVKAIENAAPIEEVLTYQRGGIFVREAVISAPQRRVDTALKHIAQGSYGKAFQNPKPASECLADELMAASRNDQGSFALAERLRREKKNKNAQ